MRISMQEAETNLAALLHRTRQGERFVIECDGEAVAELMPITRSLFRRQSGVDQGLMRIADDFDAPLPDAVLREFAG